MKKRLLLSLVTMGLAVGGFVGLDADPASAHIFDERARRTCVRTGSGFAPGVLVHAHPLWMNEHVVQYGCLGHPLSGGECRWEGLMWADGTITGPYNVTGNCY